MLTELTVVEPRYLAVREALDGARITDIAIRYRLDRRTVHRWLVRYATEGLGALADRTSRPDRCPHQIAPELEVRIVTLRRPTPAEAPGPSCPSCAGSWTRLRPVPRSIAAWSATRLIDPTPQTA